MTIKVGDIAPDFNLPTDNNGQVSLSSLKGQNVVLYFYPKDDTPGCTIEAKDFASLSEEFKANNTCIIGISKDSVQSHDKFKQKYCLPFTLVSDVKGEVCDQYGTWVEKSKFGKKYMGINRTTFLIDQNSVIRKVWQDVSVAGHAAELLNEAKKLK